MNTTLLSVILALTLAAGPVLSVAVASEQNTITENTQQETVEVQKNTEETPENTRQKTEGGPMMKTYLENDLKTFESYLDTADTETLTEYLTLAVDQQRAPFIEAILKYMPNDWNADDIVDTMVQGHAQHMVRSLLDYTSAEKHAGWLDIAIANGDADLAACLLAKLPDADTKALAGQVYQNMHDEETRFGALRYIAVFEVFRTHLSADEISAFYEQAVADGEKDFVAYLGKKVA